MKVQDILDSKGSEVMTIGSDESLADAVQSLIQKGIGSLIVLDPGDEIVGMLTERDILTATVHISSSLADTPVRRAMTREVIVGEPGDDLSTVENLMTEKRIRHLPIFDEGRLVGLVSIGDVVKHQKTACGFKNRFLTDYIERKYPA